MMGREKKPTERTERAKRADPGGRERGMIEGVVRRECDDERVCDDERECDEERECKDAGGMCDGLGTWKVTSGLHCGETNPTQWVGIGMTQPLGGGLRCR